MLSPQRIPIIRTTTVPRRVRPAHRIRQPIDTGRLKTVSRAEIYGALLLLEERAEESRDALRAGDDVTAAAISRELAQRAATISGVLNRLGTP